MPETVGHCVGYRDPGREQVREAASSEFESEHLAALPLLGRVISSKSLHFSVSDSTSEKLRGLFDTCLQSTYCRVSSNHLFDVHGKKANKYILCGQEQ